MSKYNVDEYLIDFDRKQKDKFDEIMKEMKIGVSYDNTKKCNLLKISDPKLVIKLQEELSKNKIYVNLFRRNYPDLTDIYEDMIIYGSRDTMKETLDNKK